MKREERVLCRLLTSFLSRMRSRCLNNQWRFRRVRHNPENRFAREFAEALYKRSKHIEDSKREITEHHEKAKESNKACVGVNSDRFKRLAKQSPGTSEKWGKRRNCKQQLTRRPLVLPVGRSKRFAVARRETRKRIASLKETKHDFSL